MKRAHRDTRSLAVERLDKRELMAGNVQVSVQKGVLTLVGDDSPNAVMVYQDTNSRSGEFIVTPVARSSPPYNLIDTLVNGHSQPQKFKGVSRGIQADMRGGDDTLVIMGRGARTASIPGPVGVAVVLGAGDDWFTLSNAKVAASCAIYGQEGNDRITASFVTASAGLGIDAGNGTNDVALNDSKIGGSLAVGTGKGDDQLRVYRTSADAIFTALGDGNDYFAITDSSSKKLPGFDGGNGWDRFAYYNNKFPRGFAYAPPYCTNWDKTG